MRVTQARIEELEKLKTPPRNGTLLDPLEAVIQYTSTMTWKGKHPLFTLVTTYQTGVKLTKKAMKVVESHLERLPILDKWFVDIGCPSPASRDS